MNLLLPISIKNDIIIITFLLLIFTGVFMKKVLKIISLSFITSAFLSNTALARSYNSNASTGAEEVNKNTADNSYGHSPNQTGNKKSTSKKSNDDKTSKETESNRTSY